MKLANSDDVVKLAEEEGEKLTSKFSEDKVRQAIWECESSKSAGPDGFNMGFSKQAGLSLRTI